MSGILSLIREHGRLAVPAPGAGANYSGGMDPDFLDPDIKEADRLARLDIAGIAPDLFLPAARWALTLLARSCIFFAYREIGPEVIRESFAVPCPHSPDGPSADAYAVDLSLQHLPDLVRLARGLSPEDPLVTSLRDLGKAWPLSSVGIAEIDNDATLDLSPIISHPALLALYVDRILTRHVAARITHPAVRQALHAAIGVHDDFSPDIARLLTEKI